MGDPVVYMQWKGTDTCLDFSCPSCEFFEHYCTRMPTCNAIKCEGCGKVYEIAYEIPLTEVGPDHPNWKHYNKYGIGVDGRFRS